MSKHPTNKDDPSPEKRASLLIRCTVEEAERIRDAAQRERRTVSAYVLRAVMNRMRVQDNYRPRLNPQALPKQPGENGVAYTQPRRKRDGEGARAG